MVREEGTADARLAHPKRSRPVCREARRQGQGSQWAEADRGSHEGNEQPQDSLDLLINWIEKSLCWERPGEPECFGALCLDTVMVRYE